MFCSGEGASGISFESMHGKDSHTIRAADLKLDRFLSDADRKAAAEAGEQLPVEPEVVLLTGRERLPGQVPAAGPAAARRVKVRPPPL